MTTPTFTCDRCGKNWTGWGHQTVNRLLCDGCQDALRQEIDNYQSATSEGKVGSSARTTLAWLMWCFSEGYVTPEDREILINRFAEPGAHPDDVKDREALLAMADEILDQFAGEGGAESTDSLHSQDVAAPSPVSADVAPLGENDEPSIGSVVWSERDDIDISRRSNGNWSWDRFPDHEGIIPWHLLHEHCSPLFLHSRASVPSPVPLVDRLRDAYRIKHHVMVHEAADRIEELEAEMATMHRSVVHECCEKVQELEAALADPEPKTLGTAGNTMTSAWEPDRPVDLASDDRLIHLPGGRIAVAAQDLRAGDVVQGWPITELREDRFGCVALVVGSDFFSWPYGALVLLDKAADR